MLRVNFNKYSYLALAFHPPIPAVSCTTHRVQSMKTAMQGSEKCAMQDVQGELYDWTQFILEETQARIHLHPASTDLIPTPTPIIVGSISGTVSTPLFSGHCGFFWIAQICTMSAHLLFYCFWQIFVKRRGYYLSIILFHFHTLKPYFFLANPFYHQITVAECR